ncbi:MAG TPA: hypothetical protein VNO30_20835 [Kofleriaceae bacterium]|nr:hypothetical protein [Kofleriaceae bacterium]
MFENLEPHRIQIRKIYTPMVWGVIESMRSPDLDEIGQEVALDLFDRVADEALWAVTEIQPLDELKYFSQRFISEAVRTRWSALSAANAKHKYLYFKGPTGRVDIKHEHVVPRDRLKKALAAADSSEAVRRILERPIACVVSIDEDSTLPKGGIGWERYIDKVRVFDRLKQDWADLASLATNQT